jgi:alpha-1,6-mannosyltransferase
LRVDGALTGPAPVKARIGRRAEAGARADRTIAAVSLAAILLCCLLLVVMAADRPSILVPVTTQRFFPGWLAGPLGGLWPSLTRSSDALKYIFTGAIVAMYASYLIGLRHMPRLRARWAIAAVVAAHAILLLAPPLSLTDVFNYINYGRMEVLHNLNPYTTIPVLEPHSDPAFALSNWHELLSPYGPLFTLITFIVVPLGVAGSFWALKALLMLASLATVALVWGCARLLGRDPVTAIVLVGLNPIVLIWGLGGDHNDFFMMLFVVLAFYLLLRAGAMPGLRGAADRRDGEDGALAEEGAVDRTPAPAVAGGLDSRPGAGARNALSPALLGAGAALATAVAIKASAAVLLPVVLAGLWWNRRAGAQVLLGAALGAVVLGTVSVLAFGPHIPDLGTQGRLVTYLSLPNLLGLALGQGGETNTLRVLLGGALVVSIALCGVLAWRRRESLTAAGWASVALLATLAWVLPWYVLWVLPLAALSSSRRLRIATMVLGAYLIVSWVPATGTLLNAIDFHPDKTSLGRLHQRYVKELLY